MKRLERVKESMEELANRGLAYLHRTGRTMTAVEIADHIDAHQCRHYTLARFARYIFVDPRFHTTKTWKVADHRCGCPECTPKH